MTACGSCATELSDSAKFCHECGTAQIQRESHAEYKQVTVLFADVVQSMDIAAAVGPERLREIMADLLDRCAAVVKRYGGTLDKFTGDGIMAVFGAPISLEDHAFRACASALQIQAEADVVAHHVRLRDGMDLRLRIGLNSGQVIAGDVGSSLSSYTAMGEQVGLAQRMESVAPPGGVMLTESTARLVEDLVVLDEPDEVEIKNVKAPVPARRLLAMREHEPRRLTQSRLVGRTWELNTLTALLDEARSGAGCVVGVVGPAGIGKSRLVREIVTVAAARGVEVIATYCESHTSDIPFHVAGRFLRTATGADKLDPTVARSQIRAGLPDADREDLLFFEDLMGIRDPSIALPDVAPDARRRRLTAMLNAASLARTAPALYVIEDAHWIDEPSEAMFAEFFKVIPQTPGLVLVTHRPEYQGPLSRVSGAQTIGLRPLTESQASELTSAFLGSDPSVRELAAVIGSRAAGNPFFVEEMLRDAVERGVLSGSPGAYRLHDTGAQINVPPTLQATIGARIDRLVPTAKRTLHAAAVIGMRFDSQLLNELVESVDISTLLAAELIDQVRFTEPAEYAFRHPMIRTVAYESQLVADRARSHTHLANIIEAHGKSDENAALIAENLEAAGDLANAYEWHMRAGAWSLFRDINAARTSWYRARRVADHLPEGYGQRTAMRIAPRTLLCGTCYRAAGDVTGDFDEFRRLCMAAGDHQSLLIGMAGATTALSFNGKRSEASELAAELIERLEALGDPTMIVGLSFAATGNMYERGRVREVLRLSERVIQLAGDDVSMGDLLFPSPVATQLAFRGAARLCLNLPGAGEDFRRAHAIARSLHPSVRVATLSTEVAVSLTHGIRIVNSSFVHDSAELLELAQRTGEDFTLAMAQIIRGLVLAYSADDECRHGISLLADVRDSALSREFGSSFLPIIGTETAGAMRRDGDLEGAVTLASEILTSCLETGYLMLVAPTTAVLVEALLGRANHGDLERAQKAVDDLAGVPTDAGFVINEVWLLRLRALLARARGHDASYADYRDNYREMATNLGFEGHMAWAAAMA